MRVLIFANGDDAKDFIIKEEEFKAAFNRFAVCAYLCNVSILAFSIEDSHPHALLWGTGERVLDFKDKYRDLSVRYITKHRGSADGVTLNCDLCKISDEEYLRNAASYVIVQATKDGKPVLPYDYLFGTGALYFRKPGTILPWDHDFHSRQTTKHLDTMERITLAQDLREKYLLSFRQLATVVKLPESEVRKYVK